MLDGVKTFQIRKILQIQVNIGLTGAFAIGIARSRTLRKPYTFMSRVSMISRCERGAHTQKITKNIYYISNDDVKITLDMKTMKLNKTSNRPVCIMLNWLQATHKQVMKYANLYLEEGFDVIRVFCVPWQIACPRIGTQVIGRDLIRLMAANERSYVVHGFSVGGYVWAEALVYAMTNRDLYQPVLERVEAQIWDSVVDFTEIAVGLSLTLFPNNKIQQNVTKLLINLYVRMFYNTATRHYEKACETYYASPCRAPALFLLSSVDPVGNECRIRRVYELWEDMGIQCTWKCWPDSAHVMHYLSHTEEYVSRVRAHVRHNVSALRTCEPFTPVEFERLKAKL